MYSAPYLFVLVSIQCYFQLLFESVLKLKFLTAYLTSLQTFFIHISCLQTLYFVFSDPANNFFPYFSSPLQKNNGPSLSTVSLNTALRWTVEF